LQESKIIHHYAKYQYKTETNNNIVWKKHYKHLTSNSKWLSHMQIRKQNELIFSEKRTEIENHTLSKFTRKIALGAGLSLSLAEYSELSKSNM
jgi:hypothetical protein